MGKTRKYKNICDVNKDQCSPYFCKYTKKCVPKKTVKLEMLTLTNSFKKGAKCPTPDNCLILGVQVDDARSYFHGLTTFEDVHAMARRIKTSSGSGFIYEIPYQRKEKVTYAMLKSSKRSNSDNLLYEFIIGYTYINPLVDKLPCFIYTYGLYYYKHKKDWERMFTSESVSPQHLKKMLVPQTSIQYDKACTDSKYLSMLIQGLHHSERMSDKIVSQRFLNDDAVNVLFILYHTLSTLAKSFTHYDLHVENVLLVRLPSKKCIRYVYHIHGKEITFICPYIPKIIDYGRCFFDNGTIHSKMVYDKICSVPECESCGKYAGFALLSPHKFYTISSQQKNESHDLRLLKGIHVEMEYSKANSSPMFLKLYDLLQKVIYGKGIRGSKKNYGTIEKTKIHYDGSAIGNVTDAYLQLLYLISSNEAKQHNRIYTNEDVDGTLHVYEDRPMVYES